MDQKEFTEKLLKKQRLSRELLLAPGDSGKLPLTKISGVPWWPQGVSRPQCNRKHYLSFMGQFLLTDVPGCETFSDTLVSFHYCQQCAYDGKMSWGWEFPEEDHSGYNVSIFRSVQNQKPDELGILAEVVIEPHTVTFRDVVEVPGFEETMELYPDSPDDYPQGRDDFDENIYPGLLHICRNKLGGWPTWVQSLSPPHHRNDEKLVFLGQLDWHIGDQTTWGGGGYAYLFLILSADGEPVRGEMSIQVT